MMPLCNFIIHQKKGGIHDINRYEMGTFGSFLAAGLS